MMLPVSALLPITPDHVEAATSGEALLYIAAVVLWLAGVVMLILRKLRSA